MKDLTANVSSVMQELGSSFLLAYYLPAVILLMVNVQVLAPIWLHMAEYDITTAVTTARSNSSAVTTADSTEKTPAETVAVDDATGLLSLIDGLDAQLGEIISAVFIPFLIGLVLLALNDLIIRGFEGKLPWLRYGLLRFWQRRNEHRCRVRYGALAELQAEYRRLSGELWRAPTEEDQLRLAQLQAGLAQQIDAEHDRITPEMSSQPLPQAVHRVAPTTFGNIYAEAEEYPYTRYGIDGVLFWPRLRTLMQDHAPEQSSRISYAKTFLDLSLNFCLLAGIIFLEGMATWLWLTVTGCGAWQPLLLLLLLASLLLTIGFYASSVGRIALLGELIKSSYERYRHLILDVFNLQQPTALAEEQILWVQLAAFIRRGNDFYFPKGFQKQQGPNQSIPKA